jgi:hypothetical protein
MAEKPPISPTTARLLDETDWSLTPLGPRESWPAGLTPGDGVRFPDGGALGPATGDDLQ